MMRKLIAIIAVFGLLGCVSAAAASQSKGAGKNPQATSQQIAPAAGTRKGPARKLTPDKVESGSKNIKR